MDDFKFASSLWDTSLLCNDVSHWPGASLELALVYFLYYILYERLLENEATLNDRYIFWIHKSNQQIQTKRVKPCSYITGYSAWAFMLRYITPEAQNAIMPGLFYKKHNIWVHNDRRGCSWSYNGTSCDSCYDLSHDLWEKPYNHFQNSSRTFVNNINFVSKRSPTAVTDERTDVNCFEVSYKEM